VVGLGISDMLTTAQAGNAEPVMMEMRHMTLTWLYLWRRREWLNK